MFECFIKFSFLRQHPGQILFRIHRRWRVSPWVWLWILSWILMRMDSVKRSSNLMIGVNWDLDFTMRDLALSVRSHIVLWVIYICHAFATSSDWRSMREAFDSTILAAALACHRDVWTAFFVFSAGGWRFCFGSGFWRSECLFYLEAADGTFWSTFFLARFNKVIIKISAMSVWAKSKAHCRKEYHWKI